MQFNSETNGSTDSETFVDNRARQATLDVGQDCKATADRESQIESGASESFVDDRPDDAPDAGQQDRIAVDAVGDGQQDLTGEPAGEKPAWAETGESQESSDGSGDGGMGFDDYGFGQGDQVIVDWSEESGASEQKIMRPSAIDEVDGVVMVTVKETSCYFPKPIVHEIPVGRVQKYTDEVWMGSDDSDGESVNVGKTDGWRDSLNPDDLDGKYSVAATQLAAIADRVPETVAGWVRKKFVTEDNSTGPYSAQGPAPGVEWTKPEQSYPRIIVRPSGRRRWAVTVWHESSCTTPTEGESTPGSAIEAAISYMEEN